MKETTDPPRLLTPGVLADRLGVPLHRVTYILNTRPHIRPAAKAGILRLYDAQAVEAVRAELDRITQWKECKP